MNLPHIFHGMKAAWPNIEVHLTFITVSLRHLYHWILHAFLADMFGIVFKRKKIRFQELEFELRVGSLNSYLFSFTVILKGMFTLVCTLWRVSELIDLTINIPRVCNGTLKLKNQFKVPEFTENTKWEIYWKCL